jgi:hypothetical protein
MLEAIRVQKTLAELWARKHGQGELATQESGRVDRFWEADGSG